MWALKGRGILRGGEAARDLGQFIFGQQEGKISAPLWMDDWLHAICCAQ